MKPVCGNYCLSDVLHGWKGSRRYRRMKVATATTREINCGFLNQDWLFLRGQKHDKKTCRTTLHQHQRQPCRVDTRPVGCMDSCCPLEIPRRLSASVEIQPVLSAASDFRSCRRQRNLAAAVAQPPRSETLVLLTTVVMSGYQSDQLHPSLAIVL